MKKLGVPFLLVLNFGLQHCQVWAFYVPNAVLQREPEYLEFCAGVNADSRVLASMLTELTEQQGNVDNIRRIEDKLRFSLAIMSEFNDMRIRIDCLLEPLFDRLENKIHRLLAAKFSQQQSIEKDNLFMSIYARLFWLACNFMKRAKRETLDSWLETLDQLCDNTGFRIYLWISDFLDSKTVRALNQEFQLMCYSALSKAFQTMIEISDQGVVVEGEGDQGFCPDVAPVLITVYPCELVPKHQSTCSTTASVLTIDTTTDITVEDWPPFE